MDDQMETPLGFWGSSAEEMLVSHFPIHRACRDGDPVTLSRLVAQASPDQLVIEDQFYNWTPIHWAAYFGQIECMLGLLRCGVNVNIQTSQYKQTPFHIASFGGHPQTLIELLKAGADFDARDFLGETPLHKAARIGHSGCIETLLSFGTPLIACNKNEQTACDIARQQHFPECVHLLEQAYAHLTQENSNEMGRHRFENGSSGSHVVSLSNGNGFNSSKNNFNRKRAFDDPSIPLIKRPRISEMEKTSFSSFKNGDNCMKIDDSLPVSSNSYHPQRSLTSAEKYVLKLQGHTNGDENEQCYENYDKNSLMAFLKTHNGLRSTNMGHYF